MITNEHFPGLIQELIKNLRYGIAENSSEVFKKSFTLLNKLFIETLQRCYEGSDELIFFAEESYKFSLKLKESGKIGGDVHKRIAYRLGDNMWFAFDSLSEYFRTQPDQNLKSKKRPEEIPMIPLSRLLNLTKLALERNDLSSFRIFLNALTQDFKWIENLESDRTELEDVYKTDSDYVIRYAAPGRAHRLALRVLRYWFIYLHSLEKIDLELKEVIKMKTLEVNSSYKMASLIEDLILLSRYHNNFDTVSWKDNLLGVEREYEYYSRPYDWFWIGFMEDILTYTDKAADVSESIVTVDKPTIKNIIDELERAYYKNQDYLDSNSNSFEDNSIILALYDFIDEHPLSKIVEKGLDLDRVNVFELQNEGAFVHHSLIHHLNKHYNIPHSTNEMPDAWSDTQFKLGMRKDFSFGFHWEDVDISKRYGKNWAEQSDAQFLSSLTNDHRVERIGDYNLEETIDTALNQEYYSGQRSEMIILVEKSLTLTKLQLQNSKHFSPASRRDELNQFSIGKYKGIEVIETALPNEYYNLAVLDLQSAFSISLREKDEILDHINISLNFLNEQQAEKALISDRFTKSLWQEQVFDASQKTKVLKLMNMGIITFQRTFKIDIVNHQTIQLIKVE